MDEFKLADDAFEQARRQESKAHNDLDYRSRQATEQQSQLDSLLQYKDECIEGLKAAKATGLTPVHIRELQLLMTHVNSIIETVAYKVDITQDNYEEAKEVWQEKSAHFEKVKELIKQKEEMEKEKMIEESNDADDKNGIRKLGRTGYYGDDAISMVQKSKRRY